MRVGKLVMLGLFMVPAMADAVPCAGFTDLDDSSPFCVNVTWMKNRGITLGCTTTQYCPNQDVTRLQMALFMNRLGDITFQQGGNAFNALTGPAVLGTVTAQPLEIVAGSRRVMRFEPDLVSPNVIGGNLFNHVSPGVRGATIAGGGVAFGDSDPDFGFEAMTRVTDHYGTVGGGYANQAGDGAGTVLDKPFATIGGGGFNLATGAYATVAGGGANHATSAHASVGGGEQNRATGLHATISGGKINQATGASAVVAGGGGVIPAGCPLPPQDCSNLASGDYSTVSGGQTSLASGHYATVGGGDRNQAADDYATVSGGSVNGARGFLSAVGGGIRNFSLGRASFAVGENTRASGDASVTLGYFAEAAHHGCFVFGDRSTSNPVGCYGGPNEVVFRGLGGFWMFTGGTGIGPTPYSGAHLAPGSGSWTIWSDRNGKENVQVVDSLDVLAKVASMPIATWNWAAQSETIRHMGPMAQDFYAAFGLGESDKGSAPSMRTGWPSPRFRG